MSIDSLDDVTDDAQDDDEATPISDEMLEVEARTTSDGIVEGTVSAICRSETPYGAQYVVVVEMPYGESVERNFSIPSAWTDGYAFVRWVETNGYGPGSIERMAEDDARVAVAVDGDSRELVVPDPPEPRIDISVAECKHRVAKYTVLGAWLATTTTAAVLGVLYPSSSGSIWWIDALVGGGLGLIVGVFVAFGLLLVFNDWLGWIGGHED